MVKQGVAVLLGFVVWSVIWLGGNALLVELHVLPGGADTPIQAAAPLLVLLACAVLATLAAGYAAGMSSPSGSRRTALILGVVLVVVGVAVQSQFWHLMPLWYHVAFLALLLPVCLLGTKLRRT